MNDPRVGWALAGLALVVGYAGWGWRGLVLAVTVIAFWLLLQFNRAVRAMRNASHAPIGSVPSAVMLHAKLKRGMALVEILPITGSLGQLQPGTDKAGEERFVWQDAGGRRVLAVLQHGRLTSWELSSEAADGPPAAA